MPLFCFLADSIYSVGICCFFVKIPNFERKMPLLKLTKSDRATSIAVESIGELKRKGTKIRIEIEILNLYLIRTVYYQNMTNIFTWPRIYRAWSNFYYFIDLFSIKIYTITRLIYAFALVLAHDLLEDRHIDEVKHVSTLCFSFSMPQKLC